MEKSHSPDRFPSSGQDSRSTPSKESSQLPFDIVSVLFGSRVGSLADFACTHRRIRGRIYATSESILFYSNLLGFETRITLLLADVQSLELCRTTSIELQLSDGEVYTFRSFQDREHVLRLLTALKTSDDIKRNMHRNGSLQKSLPTRRGPGSLQPQASDPTTLASLRTAMPTSASTPLLPHNDSPDDAYSLSSVATPLRSNRRRAASENNVDSMTLQPPVVASPQRRREPDDSFLSEEEEEDDDVADVLADKSLQSDETERNATIEDWKVASEMKHAIGADHVGIDCLILPCSLQVFYQVFLADNAPYSTDRYQQEQMGDRDLQMTPWTAADDVDNGTLTRTMTFVHPIKNSMGMGPTEARTSRTQQLVRYGEFGLTIESTTQVTGIPAADTFLVKDHWLVEALQGETEQTRLTICFGTHFYKRSMLKGFIEKSILAQTTEWYAGYTKMLKLALDNQATGSVDKVRAEPDTMPAIHDERFDGLERKIYCLTVLLLCLGLVTVAMVIYIKVLRGWVIALSAEVAASKNDLIDAAQTLRQMI